MVDVQTFRTALAELAAGVNIVTTCLGPERRGITATAVCSVCAEPATILACTNQSTGTFKMIRTSGHFAVNILTDAHQQIAETFAGRSGLQGNERFDPAFWTQGGVLGVPVLNGATALECEVSQIVMSGTHAVIFGRVVGAEVKPITPLVYHGGNFRGLTALNESVTV